MHLKVPLKLRQNAFFKKSWKALILQEYFMMEFIVLCCFLCKLLFFTEFCENSLISSQNFRPLETIGNLPRPTGPSEIAKSGNYEFI